MLDATCASVNIQYPQDVSLLSESREKRKFCKEHGIRLSGPKLDRPSPTAKVDKKKVSDSKQGVSTSNIHFVKLLPK